MLYATLPVSKSLLVEGDLLLFLLLLDLDALLEVFLVSLGLHLGFLFLLSGLLLIAGFVAALAFVLLLRVDLALFQLLTVVLDVLVGHVELLLGVLNFLVDLGKNELFRSAQLVVNKPEALVQAFDSRDDVLLANLQVTDFDVEVNLDLVNGTLKEDHLLTLLLVVNLLAFWHFVILGHLKVVLAEGASCLFDLSLLVLVLTSVHNLLGTQFIDRLLTGLACNLTLFTALVSVGLVHLGLARASRSNGTGLGLFLAFIAIVSAFHMVKAHLVLTHLVFLLGSDLALKDLLEFVDVVREEF